MKSNKSTNETPEKFGIYKKFVQIFPFLESKKFIETLSKQGKTVDYQQFWKFLNDRQPSVVWAKYDLDSVEFIESEKEFKVTITKSK